MRTARLFVLPVLLLSILGCGLMSGIQKIQDAATQLPDMLTAAPTMMDAMETAAAEFTPPADGTPGAPGSLSLANAKAMLEMTQQFKFTDETVDGQPAAVARLNETGQASFPVMKDFSAAYVGDPASLSKIKISAPRSDSQDSVDQGIALTNLALAGAIPPEAQAGFTSWLTENYAGVAVSGKLDKTIAEFQFTLERSDTTETLTVTPASK